MNLKGRNWISGLKSRHYILSAHTRTEVPQES